MTRREPEAPSSNLHSAWSRLFVRALARAGVRDVVISPGSRSTPLVLAAAGDPEVRCHTVLDERAAGFFALGQARVTGRPSALLCTSGTAGAHYLPAVIEAAQSYVPLVCVTADRPWEAYDAAAPQTIDQVKLFGAHVRHYAELGLPDPAVTALRAVPRVAAQAVARARGPVPGPVHVNARFRKPLEPVDVPGGPEPWAAEMDALLAAGAPPVFAQESAVDPRAVAELVAAARRARRGLIVCGPRPLARDPARERDALCALARATGFAVLAEATSQVRFASTREREDVTLCAAFDTVLRDAAFRAAHPADVILEFGAPPVSGAYATYLAGLREVARYVVAPHGWGDPLGGATAIVHGELADVALAVASQLARGEPVPERGAAAAWTADFARADALAWEIAARLADEPATLSEARVARALLDALPEGAVLVVGNSSPVRDLDTWCAPGARAPRVIHQRGASGIDGLLAGAAGARSTTDAPAVALLVGDLSLLHDLTSLGVARAVGGRLVVVAVQNGGGRIFEALPIARRSELGAVFDRHFVTPQQVDLAAAARAFGVRFERVDTPATYAAALARALGAAEVTLIEAVVPPHDGAARRDALARETAASLGRPR